MSRAVPKPKLQKQKPRFWRQKDPEFRRAIREQDCLIAFRSIARRVGANDEVLGGQWVQHRCWGPIDPAHIGKHQATGAADFGAIVPLCRAAHRYYDEHRSSWAKVTGYTDAKMQACAADYALRFLESGGLPQRDGAEA